ncbi:MAG: hypothetical protein RLY31_2680 [Bacteroidota bacterium]
MATIDIPTVQQVRITYELASLRDRFLAFLLDLSIFYVLYFLFFLTCLFFLDKYITEWGQAFLLKLQLFGLPAYHLLSELLSAGQTWGKKALGIRVVRLDGREPGLRDHLLRALFLFADLFLSAGMLGAVLIGTTGRSQRLGDQAAHTTVVRLRSKLHFQLADILKIQATDQYVPRYPAVRELSEHDLLLINQLLHRLEKWSNEAHRQASEEAVRHICRRLDIRPVPQDPVPFLRTLIHDYIILTR